MTNQNGIGAQNTAMYSGMNGGIMPSAGHYSDMQTLMQNMESLSGWLEQNRQDWATVQEGIARVERLQVWNGLKYPHRVLHRDSFVEHDHVLKAHAFTEPMI
jgi:hypothetical protein